MKREELRMGKLSHPTLGFYLLLLLVAAVFYLSSDFPAGYLDLQKQLKSAFKNDAPAPYEEKSSSSSSSSSNSSSSCDLFSGKWVFDNVSVPYYEEGKCSFMASDFACEKYGRKDLEFRNWRWQPHHCDLPRFNGTAFLEKIRGKKLIFVGDSLNRNQWTSMLCMVESALSPSSDKTIVFRSESMLSFVSNEYNASIEFYWSPLLVESNADDVKSHHLKNRAIRLNGIERNARHWNDADILVFDSYAWWSDIVTVVWGSSLESSDAIYKTVENMDARLYEMALDEWSNWLEININQTKTNMFFMSPSPYHAYGASFEEQRSCYNETEPIFEDKLIGVSVVRDRMKIAELALQKLETRGIKIEYMNITHLSQYRKDAHPSIYRNFFNTISEEQLKDPVSYSDCVHWCLPGVPDVWNHLIYSHIMKL